MVALAFAIIGVAYSVVNHTQAMRMFASRTEWHLKMPIFAASVPLLIMTFCNLSIGIMGRALVPEQADLPEGRQDAIYPFLVSQIDAIGLKGLVIAGVFAAALSRRTTPSGHPCQLCSRATSMPGSLFAIATITTTCASVSGSLPSSSSDRLPTCLSCSRGECSSSTST